MLEGGRSEPQLTADIMVNPGDDDTRLLTRYLLGSLPEEEEIRLESEYLADPAVQDRLLVLLPEAWVEYRDRGLAWAEMGDARLAVSDLEIYILHTEDALDRDAMDQRLQELKRALN